MECDVAKCVAIAQAQGAELGVAEPCCVRQQGLEHGLELAGRTGDDAQHLGRGGLLLQRFAQLVEEARVLDGDDRLRGEVLH